MGEQPLMFTGMVCCSLPRRGGGEQAGIRTGLLGGLRAGEREAGGTPGSKGSPSVREVQSQDAGRGFCWLWDDQQLNCVLAILIKAIEMAERKKNRRVVGSRRGDARGVGEGACEASPQNPEEALSQKRKASRTECRNGQGGLQSSFCCCCWSRRFRMRNSMLPTGGGRFASQEAGYE